MRLLGSVLFQDGGSVAFVSPMFPSTELDHQLTLVQVLQCYLEMSIGSLSLVKGHAHA